MSATLDEQKEVNRLHKRLDESRINNSSSTTTNSTSLASLIKVKSLRFLRAAALFFHFYTDVPLSLDGHLGMTYGDLTAYLGLPDNLADFLRTPGMDGIIDNLLLFRKRNVCVDPPKLPCSPRSLIDLPNDYVTLLNKAAQYRCPSSVYCASDGSLLSGESSKTPAICLICGSVVCFQVN